MKRFFIFYYIFNYDDLKNDTVFDIVVLLLGGKLCGTSFEGVFFAK